jgi:DNA-binding response OmpR family regulator
MQKKVVVFDDELDIRELLKYNLSREGFCVVAFPNPLDGISYLEKNIPDIILSDWLMPEMSGLEFCRTIKNDKNLSNIPLIMISCKGDESDIDLALKNGADDYMVKPFRIKELVDKMNYVMENRTDSHQPN